MQEVTLTIYDVETGEEEQVKIDSRRFSIGRLPENDLAIEDTSLSRRHALIETVDGSLIVSDCGSQNGTFVNGKTVIGAVELHDGDVLTFGGSKEITVEISRKSDPGINYASGTAAAAGHPTPVADKRGSVSAAVPLWLNPPVLATIAIVLILLGAGLLLALKQNGSATSVASTRPVTPNQNSPIVTNPQVTPARVADTPPDNKVEANDNSNELRIIDKHARTVMRSISDDRSPVLSSEVVSQINEKVKRYAGSSVLGDQLRTVKQRGVAQLAETARDNDLKLPLAMFVALAKMDRDGQRGDPVSVAQGLMPTLARLRITFGTELANDSLLIVATIDQPPQGNFHPLQLTMNKLANDTRESANKIRTVWYLYKHQKLSAQAYDLVIRFLAIGVIAQDPRHFGIDAEPLVF